MSATDPRVWARHTARRAAASVVAAGMLVLAGCSAGPDPLGLACPAVGWLNTVTVEVTSSAYDVSAVELCGGGWADCITPHSTYSPAGPQYAPFVSHTGQSWTFRTPSAPDALTILVLDADGVQRDVREVAVDWEPSADYGPCGGPGEAHIDLPL